MKAIITFDCHIEIDVDDKSCRDIVPVREQIEQMETLLKEECDCERVEITGYNYYLVPTV